MPIYTFGSVDERESGDVWQILCPGPSMDRTHEQVLRSLPSIAVNGAIMSPISVGWWSVWSVPRDGAQLERARDIRPRIIGNYNIHRWRRAMNDFGYEVDVLLSPRPIEHLRGGWSAEHLRHGPAFLSAIRFAVLIGGAKEVRCFGLDLRGEGYAFGLKDRMLRTPEVWAGRWRGERNIAARLMWLGRSEGWRMKRYG